MITLRSARSGDTVKIGTVSVRIPYRDEKSAELFGEEEKRNLLAEGFTVIQRCKPLHVHFEEQIKQRGWRVNHVAVKVAGPPDMVQYRIQDPQYDNRAPEIIAGNTKYFSGRDLDEAAEKAWIALGYETELLTELSFCSKLDRLQGILEPLNS